MMSLPFNKYQGAGNDFVVIDATRTPFDLTPAQLRTQQPLRGLQHLVGVRRTVLTRDIANEKGRFDGKRKLRHGLLRSVAGGIARDRPQHAAAQVSWFADGR